MPIAAGNWPRSPRILVVEDEPVIAGLIADVLRGEEMQVEVALHARDALGKVERSAFDLVICDLLMPEIDGVSFFLELERQGSPLVGRMLFITGDAQAPEKREFLHSRRLAYLVKPFRMGELIAAVRRALCELRSAITQPSQQEDKRVPENH